MNGVPTKNKLLFNVDKCAVITFSRARCSQSKTYMLGSEPIARVTSIRDLGVVIDSHLNFHEHMTMLAADCYRRLGFVVRNARDFNDPRAIKLLYTALVRSKLEAASAVWNPHEDAYILLLEKVQKTFLRFLYKKVYGYYPFLYPTKFLLGTLGFYSLEVRRNFALMSVACGILRGDSDCPILVSQLVRLFVPPVPKYAFRERKHPLLAVPAARTVSRRKSPLVRALRMVNEFLDVAPDADVLGSGWVFVRDECLKFCVRMDARPSSVT